jgi:hypothetical protein
VSREILRFKLVSCALSGLAAGLRPSVALANPDGVELAGATIQVEAQPGAEDCPDAQALSRRTAAHGMPRGTPSAPLVIHVEFHRSDAGYEATVSTTGRTRGARELTASGPTCDPLAAATSLVLAVLLDLRPSEEAKTRLAPPPIKPAPTHDAPPSLFRYVALGPHASAAYGLLGSGPSAAFGGTTRVRLGYVEGELSGFSAVERSISYSGGFVDLNLAAGSFGLCGYPNPIGRATELGACAAVLVGGIRANGRGFYTNDEAAALWLAGRFGVTLAVPLARHWATRLGLDVLLPFRRYSVVVDRVGPVFDPPAAAVILTFGPEFRIL